MTVLQVRSGADEGVLSDSGTLVLKVLHSWYESATSTARIFRLCDHLHATNDNIHHHFIFLSVFFVIIATVIMVIALLSLSRSSLLMSCHYR